MCCTNDINRSTYKYFGIKKDNNNWRLQSVLSINFNMHIYQIKNRPICKSRRIKLKRIASARDLTCHVISEFNLTLTVGWIVYRDYN